MEGSHLAFGTLHPAGRQSSLRENDSPFGVRQGRLA